MNRDIKDLKKRADALGKPAMTAPVENNIPAAAYREIGDLLSRERAPTETEKLEMKRRGQWAFATPETLTKISEILKKYE